MATPAEPSPPTPGCDDTRRGGDVRTADAAGEPRHHRSDNQDHQSPEGQLDQHHRQVQVQLERGRLEFQCKLDKGKFKSCKSPKTYKKLKLGKHVFKVRAIDKAGNVGKPAKRKFTVLAS